MVGTSTKLPAVELIKVTAVRYAGDHKLWLRFSDGLEGVADLGAHLHGPVFGPLKDPRFFARAALDDGYTVAWPNGVDLAPEFLYQITEPTGGARKRDLARSFGDAKKAYAAQCDRMPEISRFFGIVIRMFYDEHMRPHFHARYGSHTLTVYIRDGAVLTHGFPKRAMRFVMEWHELHKRELLENWERMRHGRPPLRIPPLK